VPARRSGAVASPMRLTAAPGGRETLLLRVTMTRVLQGARSRRECRAPESLEKRLQTGGSRLAESIGGQRQRARARDPTRSAERRASAHRSWQRFPNTDSEAPTRNTVRRFFYVQIEFDLDPNEYP